MERNKASCKTVKHKEQTLAWDDWLSAPWDVCGDGGASDLWMMEETEVMKKKENNRRRKEYNYSLTEPSLHNHKPPVLSIFQFPIQSLRASPPREVYWVAIRVLATQTQKSPSTGGAV
jgi:hypothetical protein